MQNEPNFQKVKLNITKALTKDYEKKDTWWSGKKQSQTKPNKPKPKKAKMNVCPVITKDYEKTSNWTLFENKPNTNPNKPNFRANIILLLTTQEIAKKKIKKNSKWY